MLAAIPTVALAQAIDSPARLRALDRLRTHMAQGDQAQARADAEAAATEGEFGLIDTADRDNDEAPNGWGTICFTPHGRAPLILTSYPVGHYIPAGSGINLAYISAYNRALVEHRDYPYRDLCRASAKDDKLRAEDPSRVTIAARPVSGTPRDLFRPLAVEARKMLFVLYVVTRSRLATA